MCCWRHPSTPSRYLLGGHRFFFFDYMDAIGTTATCRSSSISRAIPKRPAYIGNEMENYVNDINPFWPTIWLKAWGVDDAISLAMPISPKAACRRSGSGSSRPFCPSSGLVALQSQLPEARSLTPFSSSSGCARERPRASSMISMASDKVVDAMLTLCQMGEGASKNEIVQVIKEEEVARGAQLRILPDRHGRFVQSRAVGPALAPRRTAVAGFGGNYGGYIGDVARMAVLGSRMRNWSTCSARSRTSR